MLAKLFNSPTPGQSALMDACLVPLLCFAPLFTVMGLKGMMIRHSSLYLMDDIITMLGTLGISFGLLALHLRQTALNRRLDSLEKSSPSTH